VRTITGSTLSIIDIRYCFKVGASATLARMKKVLGIVGGLVGLVVIFFGVKQIMTGAREMSGKSPTTQPQKVGETYTSIVGGYTDRIPEGWQSKPGAQPGLTMIIAPKESGYASNMATTIEAFDGSLRTYVDTNIKSVQAMFPDAKIVSDAEFTNDAKAAAYKLKLQNKVQETDLAQTMYFFEGQLGQKIIVTCTTPAKHGQELEGVFDDCMKRFALARP
jgi:hypothetical protein